MVEFSIPSSNNMIFLAEATGWKIDREWPNQWINPKTQEHLQGGWKELPNPWTSWLVALDIIETLSGEEGYKIIISKTDEYYEVWLSMFKFNTQAKGCIGLDSLSASIAVTIMACLKDEPQDLPIMETGLKDLIRTAARIMLEAVLQLIQDDPHQWSTRPCATCQAITSITAKPFGCIKYRIDKEQ